MKSVLKFNVLAILGVSTLWLAGCAGKPVRPTYVSPTKFQAFGCSQLVSEYNRIGDYLRTGVEAPTRDFRNMGIGMTIGRGGRVYPTIDMNMGSSNTSPRTIYAQLLGEQQAVAQAAQFKGCPLNIVALPQPAPAGSTPPAVATAP